MGVAFTAVTPSSAATLQPIGTFDSPVYVTSDPDDASRLFVVERGGQIKLITPSGTSQFISVPNVQAGSEQGLLSAAFPPDFNEHGRFYVFYTGTDSGALHVDEFTASGNTADPATRRPLLTIPHPTEGNHNGGQLQFGPDGYLYVSTGDGGGGGDPFENAQDLGSLLGKILRIDPRESAGQPYTVPSDNPFVGVPGEDEIWSYGLRNPWRFSFDRLTGALLIGDVGQDAWEEVDYEPAETGGGRGDNFGWDCREGAHDFEPAGCSGPFTDPIHELTHGEGFCAVTGGYVVRDPSLPELAGRYVYSDLCSPNLRSLIPGFPATDDRPESLPVHFPTTFGEDACRRIYVASLDGPVYRLEGSSSASCTLTIAVEGEGAGTVRGPEIDCPGDCQGHFPQGVHVSLRAVPDAGSSFEGWGDACTGRGSCDLTLDADGAVTATFGRELRKSESNVALRADDKRIEKSDRVELTARVRPCPERVGDRIRLLKRGDPFSRKRSNARCRATFHPELLHDARFRAAVGETAGHLADRSRVLKINVTNR
jgi:glucose/arabinose dehydrogenase